MTFSIVSATVSTRRNLRSGICIGALAASLLLAPSPALAADECGAPVDGKVSCEAADGPFSAGIAYVVQAAPPEDLTVVLEDGLAVQPAAAGTSAITVTNSGGAVRVEGAASSVSATAPNAHGIDVHAAGDLTVAIASAATTGDQSRGIVVRSDAGDITIVAGDVHSSGDRADAIYAYAFDGGIQINAGSVRADGFLSDGIHATSTGGDISVDAGDISVHVGDAIEVRADYGSYTGNATIHAGDIKSDGAGITVLAGNAIKVVAGDIETHSGTEDAGTQLGQGIKAVAHGSIDISVGNVATTGYWAEGIYATLNPGYDQTEHGGITIETGTIETSGIGSTGIVAIDHGYRYGTGQLVSVTAGAVATSGDYASGIYAVGSNVVVNAGGPITTQGVRGTGIYVAAVGGNSTVTAGEVRTAGDRAAAVRVFSAYGDVNVTTSGAISTSGDFSYGILGFGGGAITIDNSGPVTTGGAFSKGVYGLARGGTLNIVNRGDVHTTGFAADGIRAIGTGTRVEVTTTGTVRTDGDNAIGIVVARDRAGRGDRSGSGRYGYYGDHAQVTLSAGTVITTGARSTGIVGVNYDFGGSVSIDADQVSATGDGSFGIITKSFGDTSITVGDVVSSQTAIYSGVIGGDGHITVSGSAISAGNSAITTLTTFGTQTIDIGEGAVVVGNGTRDLTYGNHADGIHVDSYAGSATINNAGFITTLGDGYAIEATGQAEYYSGVVEAAVTINNSGTILGGLKLSDDDDVLNNSGLLIVTKDSDFGGGDDLFDNEGALRISMPVEGGLLRAAPRSVTISGLEQLRNSGIVDLRDGVAGDTLTIDADYQGAGDAALGLDIGDGVADRLVIGGAATGATAITLRSADDDRATLLGEPLALVVAGSGTEAGAFHLAGGDFGLIGYSLSFDERTNSFMLSTAAGGAVHRLGRTGEALRSVWARSADAWTAHMAATRDDPVLGSRLWGQMFAGFDSRDQSAAGYRLDYDQDYFGAALGYDLMQRDGFRAGVMAGYLKSEQRFDMNAQRNAFDAFSAGAYSGVRRGPLFGNLLVKYDHAAINFASGGVQESGKFDADTFGISFEAGAMWGSADLAFEPIASLTWTSSSIEDLPLLGQEIEFGSAKGLRGKAGARLSGIIGKVRAYGSAQYVHEFKGRDAVTLKSGGVSAEVRDAAIGDYGDLRIGLSIASNHGASGFFEGNASVGKGYSGGGGRVGLRIPF